MGLKELIKLTINKLKNIEVEKMSDENIKLYKIYLDNVNINLDGKVKDARTTLQLKKINRLEVYKHEIDKYIIEGKYVSINRLCGELKINRATLYNLKLNEYIEKKIDADREIKEPTKKCRSCKIEKPLSEFRPDKKGKLGVRGSCKECEGRKKDESL